ncbi:MAG: hypothetical protein FWB90_01850 [Fibromonadales bacterium]|nr:hypothetical protein [Fibromonadales bacterium]
MTHLPKILALLLFLAALVHAVNTVAVLEIVPSGEMSLKLSEYRHLTDELRTIARETLPQGSYAVLTRDNIVSLLPPDSEEAQCLAESCAVEIGRAIGAEYITQGFVGDFGGMLTLTVELYESMSGHLLGSFVTESRDVMGLLKTMREKAPGLFKKIPKPVSEKKLDVAVAVDLKPEEPPKKIDPQIEVAEKKGNASFWVALALDAVGTGLLVYGYMQHGTAVDEHKKYSDLDASVSGQDFNKAWKSVDDAKSARNISFAAGGVLLAAGIGVHIWF